MADTLRDIMAEFEGELRQVADQHGGTVNVWRPEPAEVIPLMQPESEALSDDQEFAAEDDTALLIDEGGPEALTAFSFEDIPHEDDPYQ